MTRKYVNAKCEARNAEFGMKARSANEIRQVG